MRLVPLAALLLAAPALAQPVVVLKAGPMVSTLAKPDGAGSRSLVGLAFGAAVEVPLAGPLALRAEALYAEKGEGDLDGEPPIRDIKLTYLEVPVAVVLAVPVGGVEGRVSAGAFAGRRLAADVGQSGTLREGTDVGVLAGVGLRAGALVLDARYEAGLRDIYQVNVAGEGTTRTLSVTLGYRLGGR